MGAFRVSTAFVFSLMVIASCGETSSDGDSTTRMIADAGPGRDRVAATDALIGSGGEGSATDAADAAIVTQDVNMGEAGASCTVTNGGLELCGDDADNDCNGLIDDRCDECLADQYDLDGDPTNGCEYFCPWNSDGLNTTDPGGLNACGRDDDCDGLVDEDVDLCNDVNNCGRCGKRCVNLQPPPRCLTVAAPGELCNEGNTFCELCGCGSGFANIDGSCANGCEYECPVFPLREEACNGVDDNCDGQIDEPTSDGSTCPTDAGFADSAP